ncbi:AAA family ATPase-like protein [Leptomonas pyrrhocoris]|uniref:AAA family ATPase-like protein n=1 Tax=Leptomonas pyrrhocoris TaxID=157538 RepID=A0A0M9G6D3_LEPPY|nr:AAA family ATPase-like protein [Leptomonas pyrrhocoris]XP_015661757.1 AAA family ATPase-like protein [Leptomonas pyrrhocoris]KPA83317.1 AAA family ATPase-like protein [Leptomonas pyrrhocoris]KPA83318.1 AAA family ATPase-like protein [Leptomonas pyrrhocoris]|eukprot:XP_015661756.1 AAA family ATPase-like protein [Leptomonas pyrrhocoris]
MPAKKRLVPPIRPNADGTGFVRVGRQGGPAHDRAGGPRRAVTPSSSSDAASADSPDSNAEAAAVATVATVQSRGRQSRSRASGNAAPAVAAPSPPPTEKSNRPAEIAAASPSANTPSPPANENSVPKRAKIPVLQSPASLHDVEIGVDAALGPSECLLSSRALHQLGLLNGSLVQLVTPYGEVYAEARQVRGAAAASDKLFVNEDAAALLVDRRARLVPVAVPPQGLPQLISVTLRPVPPEDPHGAAQTSAVSTAAASVQEWQAMFRRALHHKVAYLALKTTQRVLTQRLTLEVVKLITSDATHAPQDPSRSSLSTSCTPLTWGVVTDATSLFIENGETNDAAGPPFFPAVDPKPDAGAVDTSEPTGSRCTLVVGEAGTGKSRLLQRCGAQEQQLTTLPDPSSTILNPLQSGGSRHVEWVRVEELPQGEGSEVSTATALHEAFERARQSAPAVVLMDDLHLICARETSSAGSRWAMSLVAHALAEELLDLQRHHHDVWVVASAPSLDSLDGCLTGASLLGRHVVSLEMPAGPAERLACLRTCLSEIRGNGAAAAAAPPVVSEECLREVAERAHGFTQRDLNRLAETAVVKAFHARQSVAPQDADLRAAAAVVHPSSLKRFEVSVPNVTWDDIGGSAEAKQALCDVVEWCLGKQSWIFSEFNLTPPKGVLLYGPPGCSKTMLAKALANESHMNFISVKGPEVFSKWVGDSEKAVRDIFERARAASPCVVFIDELDGMCGHRGRGGVSDRVISQFLTELDGLPAAFEEKKNALVFVAATNRPDSIDGAVLRPGRIDRRVYVGLPNSAERLAIAAIQFRHIPVAADLTAGYVAERTEGYTGAEVVAVVKEAAFHAITADTKAACVALADVDAALLKVRPRIQAKDVEWYKQWPHNTQTPVE